MTHGKRQILRMCIAGLSGILLTASFPKIQAWYLTWVAVVPLLVAINNRPAGERFRLGFISGLVHYLTLVYWVVPTMITYGQVPVYVSGPVLFLFSSYLALYMAVFSVFFTRLGTSPLIFLISVPALWTALEFLRSFLFTGFPWELLGYSQYRILPLIQIADIFGVFGISFVLVLCSTAAFLLILYIRNEKLRKTTISGRTAAFSIGAAVIAVGCLWIYGTYRITTFKGKYSPAAPLRAAVIQGNIDQSIKWNPLFQTATTEKYIRLSLEARQAAPDLIVWPETATPFYFFYDKELTEKVLNGVREAEIHFLIGSNAIEGQNDAPAYFNSAFLISPSGAALGKYDKVHLVPFGEYVPLKKYLPFVGKMVEHVGDFQPGPRGNTIQFNGRRLGVLICYEMIFPELSRDMTANGASVLVNITNDAWYGTSSAPYQHFSMAVFRAIENRRGVIRAANTGISGFIDPLGQVIQSTALFEDAVATQNIPVFQALTAYTRYGDVFAIVCLWFSILVILWETIRRERLKRRSFF